MGLGDLNGGSFQSRATGVSADGTVVTGWGTTADGDEAFRWTSAGGMVGLGDLVGGSIYSRANGISEDGLVIVGKSKSTNGDEAFRWTSGGGMVGLGDLAGGSFSSEAAAATTDGSIIVGSGQSANGQEAMYWSLTTGMVSLTDYLTARSVDLTGWTLLLASSVSADGSVIAGLGIHNTKQEGFVITGLALSAVPEPSTYAMWAGLGILGFVCWRRHSRNRE